MPKVKKKDEKKNQFDSVNLVVIKLSAIFGSAFPFVNCITLPSKKLAAFGLVFAPITADFSRTNIDSTASAITPASSIFDALILAASCDGISPVFVICLRIVFAVLLLIIF